MATFYDYLKNIFLILILLQFAPPLIKNISKQYQSFLEPQTKVAVISIKGMLTDSDSYVKQLKKYFEEQDIKAILLRIDCPGGYGGSAQIVFNEIKLLKQSYTKPVIVLIENICTSAAYYVAVMGDWIIASPGAFVGSIGVYMPQPNFKKFIEQFKVQYDVIKSGEYKTAGNPLLETTPEQKKMLQGLTDNVYQQFVQAIASQRPKLILSESDKWAQGRVFTGEQGFSLGLIDELGSQSTAERVIRQKGPIEGKIEWVKAPKPSLFARMLGREDDSQDDDESYMHTFFDAFYNWYEIKAAPRAC